MEVRHGKLNETVTLFLVVIVASFVFSSLLSQIPLLRVPSAIGYLVFGVLVQNGPIRLPIDELSWISRLGDIGLLFLMFLSGLEVDMRWLNPGDTLTSGLHPLQSAVSMFLGTLLISFGASWLIAQYAPGAPQPYMLTLLLSTTSLGVIVPVLEEKGILRSAYGQTLLLTALLADVCTMLLVSLYVTVRTSGQLYQFVLALAIVPAAFMAYRFIRWIQTIRWRRRVVGDATARLRAVVALVAAACALADYTGSEPILGSFLIGVVISATPMAYQKELRSYCHGLGYGLLIPMFFLSVGLNLRLGSFHDPAVWQWTAILVLAAFIVKIIPVLPLRRQFGRRQAIAAGVLLSTRLSLIIAAADIGVRIGALPQYLDDAFTITAMITCLVAPISFLTLVPSRPVD